MKSKNECEPDNKKQMSTNIHTHLVDRLVSRCSSASSFFASSAARCASRYVLALCNQIDYAVNNDARVKQSTYSTSHHHSLSFLVADF